MTFCRKGGTCLSSTERKSHGTGSPFQQMKTLKHWKVRQKMMDGQCYPCS